VSERQASVHPGGPGRLSRDRDETLHRGTGVVGASAPRFADASPPRFAGRTRKVTCARPLKERPPKDQHDLSVVPRAGGGRGHDDIGENS